MKNTTKRILAKKITLMLVLGMISLTPQAYALPNQGIYATDNAAKAIIAPAATNVMNITGNNKNTALNWAAFNVAKGETVNFKGAENNYLNLIHDSSASQIMGALNGEGGNIYLVNPNGILFGAGAKVNVGAGALVASTRPLMNDMEVATFESSGISPFITSATTATGNITNMGTLQATSVIMEGNNVTLGNVANITSDGTTPLTGAVTIKAAGIIAVGHEVSTTTRSFKINGIDTNKNVHDYAHATITPSVYTATDLAGAPKALNEAMLVESVYDLQNMDVKLGGNYILANNIDASETKNWNDGSGFAPVGDYTNQFTGIFDGADNTIAGLTINRPTTTGVGLFGSSTGTIQNVGMVSGNIIGYNQVGGVVGANNVIKINNTITNKGTITNAYNTGAVSGSANGRDIGGVVGINNSIVTNVYNTGAVSDSSDDSNIGGVAGSNSGTITNAYNTGAVKTTSTDVVGGVVGFNSGTASNVYNTGEVYNGSSNLTGGVAGQNEGTITNAYNTGTVIQSIFSGSGVVDKNEGSINNTWYATTDAAGQSINSKTTSGVGTGKTLAELKAMKLSDYNFGDAWRTYATGKTDTLVATTPMLQAFKTTAMDNALIYDKVQYGVAETPLTNLYQTQADVSLDMNNLSLAPNVGTIIYGHNLTVNNFTSSTGDASVWGSYSDGTTGGDLFLQNDNGFTVNSGLQLFGTKSITLSATNSSTGAITDYGKNTTTTLNITAKDILLDTDRVDTVAGNAKTTVNLNAAGTAKAGYTPTGTMTATVNGTSVNVPNYASASKRTYYPTLTVKDGATLREGQWVKDVTQLQAMGENSNSKKQNYFLANDIDASATSTWNQDSATSVYQGFVPVGGNSIDNSFLGAFDGLNHTIYGLTINRSKTNYVGLFGRITGDANTIQNVGMVGGSIIGQNYVGGVVGETNYSSLTNVYNTSPVSGFKYVGGITGSLTNANAKVKNAYNTGSVSASDTDAGGIVGIAIGSNSITINNVYNTGSVSGKNGNVGGIIGSPLANITNALWAKDVSFTPATGYSKATQSIGNSVDPDTVKGVTLAEMKKSATYDSWKDTDGNNVVATTGNAGTTWRIYEGNTTPLLSGFFRSVVSVTTGLADQTKTYNGQQQNMDISQAVYDPVNVDTTHMYAGYGTNAGKYSAIYSDQQGYDLVNTSALNIKKAPLTLTTTAQTDYTYGANVAPTITDSLTGYVNGEAIDTANHTGSTSYDTATAFNSTSSHTSDAGDYTYTYNGNLIFDNYEFSTDTTGHGTGIVTVQKAAMTITPAANVTATYGDNLASKLYTYDATKLVNGDTGIKNVSGVPTYNTTAWDGTKTANASTTPYSVNLTDAGTLSSTNYTFTVNSATPGSVTIGKATAQVKPTTNASLTYGDVTGVTNAVSYAITGLLNGDSSAGESGTVNYVNGALNGTSKTQNVGTYNVTISADTGLSSTNYIFAADNTTPGTITLNKAPLTLTAQNVNMTYGDAPSSLVYGYDIDTTNKLVNSDTADVLGTITYANSAYKDATHTNDAGGTYNVSISNDFSSLANYTVTKNAGSVTVAKATARIKPTANLNVTYGNVEGIVGSYAVDTTSLVNNDTSIADLSGTVTYATTALKDSGTHTQDVSATAYDMTIDSVAGLTSTNYNFTADNTTPGKVTITKAPLTLTAQNVNMTYGDAESSLVYGYDIDTTNKLVNGDVAATVLNGITYTNLAYNGTKTNNVGRYLLSINNLNLNNYNVTRNSGIVTVGKANVTLTPAVISDSVTYGDAATLKAKLASETYTNSGLKNEDTAITGINITWVTDALKDSDTHTGNAGMHNLSLAGTSTNYNITGATTTNAITIAKAPLDINANAVNMAYGQAENEVRTQYGYSFGSNTLVNGDTEAVLGTLAYTNNAYATQVASYNATKTNNVGGAYNLSINNDYSGLTNYAVTKNTGAVTMSKANVTLTPVALANVTYGDATTLKNELVNASYTHSALANGDNTIDGLAGVTYTSAALISDNKTNNVGSYEVAASVVAAQATNYNILGGTLTNGVTIAKATAKVKPTTNASFTYGDVNGVTNGVSSAITDLVNDDTSAGATGTVNYVNGALNGTSKTQNVGTYNVTISADTGLSSTNYTFVADNTTPGTITLIKAPLTLTAKNMTLTYGDAESTLTYGYEIDATKKLVNGDTAATVLNGITYTNTAYRDATHTNDVAQTYTVTANVPNLANYNVTSNTGAVTMNKANVTLTPVDLANVTYGGVTTLKTEMENASYTHSTLVNDDTTIAGLTGITYTSAAKLSDSKTNDVGKYSLVLDATNASSTNYNIIGGTKDNAVTITKAPLTITANDVTMTYGQAESAVKGNYNYTQKGITNEDDAATVLSGITYTNNAYRDATHTKDVASTYTLTANVPTLKNYSVTSNTGAVTMSKATAKVKSATNASYTYGDVTGVTNAVSYQVTNLVNDDSSAGESGNATYINGALVGSKTRDVGNYTVTIDNIADFNSANYLFETDNTIPGTITLTKATATVTPNAIGNVTYGNTSDITNAYSYTVSDLVNEDTSAAGLTGVPEYTTGAVNGSRTGNVGTYDLTIATGSLSSTNYNFKGITKADAITINPATLTINANSVTDNGTYGDTSLANKLSYSVSGLVNGDSASVLSGTPVYTTDAWDGTKTANAGTYVVTTSGQGTLNATNYVFNLNQDKQGKVTITQAPLTLTANAVTMRQGEAVPAFTGRASGYVNGDSASEAPVFVWNGTGTPGIGSFAVLGYLGGKSSGLYGTNYYILQAASNSNALTVTNSLTQQDYGRAVTSLVPRHGNQIVTPLYGIWVDQPAGTVESPAAMAKVGENVIASNVNSSKKQQKLIGGYYIDLDGNKHQLI